MTDYTSSKVDGYTQSRGNPSVKSWAEKEAEALAPVIAAIEAAGYKHTREGSREWSKRVSLGDRGRAVYVDLWLALGKVYYTINTRRGRQYKVSIPNNLVKALARREATIMADFKQELAENDAGEAMLARVNEALIPYANMGITAERAGRFVHLNIAGMSLSSRQSMYVNDDLTIHTMLLGTRIKVNFEGMADIITLYKRLEESK